MASAPMDESYDRNWGTVLLHSKQLGHIADFGAATGLNSCQCFKSVLEELRVVSEAPVLLYHTDT